MVIEKVHGLHSTGMSLHDRFSMLASAAPDRVLQRKRRASVGSLISQNYNYSNRLIEQVARRLEMQAKRLALRQRLGYQQSNLRRVGSEGNLSGLRRSNSFGNLSQQSIKNRVAWRQSNNNLSNLANLARRARPARGFRKRGGGQRALRGKIRTGRQVGNRQVGQLRLRNGLQQNGQRRGFQQRRGMRRRGGQQQNGQRRQTQQQNGFQTQGNKQMGGAQGQRAQTARRGRARGRGGITRSQSQNRILTKEELDAQLDQYMSCTKAALDQELDNYMKNAMELE
ncbi:hypothetical protein HF086_011209 [Spodoptera exigua]|uniref:Chromatin target of PRMT1 protein C-terminal domain-containing protein n=1 Tax=Spodoptera exigua TaxID=7107 RepID=A0A922SM96_SPOEX|nr:hypothetical protein HF086_011209 [Spodoptera exigua]